MSTALARPANGNAASALEQVLGKGDLAALQPAERLQYYNLVCESTGLNPYTRPFQYIVLSNKLTLYATKDASEQLRKRDDISLTIIARDMHADVGVYIVTAHASTPKGRTDESTGAVNIKGLGGEALANALMKAETKAKRRVTLSICGLGFLDESEVDSVPNAQRVNVDLETGEIVSSPQAPQLPPAPASSASTQPAQPTTTRRASPARAATGNGELNPNAVRLHLVNYWKDQGIAAPAAAKTAEDFIKVHGLEGKALPQAELERLIAETETQAQPAEIVQMPSTAAQAQAEVARARSLLDEDDGAPF